MIRASSKTHVKQVRRSVRAVYLSRVGRRIDLPALLGQRRQDGLPVWALLDPAGPTGGANGKRDSDGTIGISSPRRPSEIQWIKILGAAYVKDGKVVAHTPDGGIPALPPAVRQLAMGKTIRRRAKWVGLLYQPDEWLEAKPDPALIVEWIDRPGEYYALAVWGHDGPRIMEFVD